jgi:purine-nucleoside phosphorylase
MKYDKILKAVAYLKEQAQKPEITLLPGSGLSNILMHITDKKLIPYNEVPSFPKLKRKDQYEYIVLGNLEGKTIAALGGRFQYCDGHTADDIAFPLRVLKEWGSKILLMTNAAGGINTSYNVGDFVIITDHIDFTGRNPLIGQNPEEIGPRFPDMSEVYDKKLIDICLRAGIENSISIKTGIYIGVTGPSYETPAEIKAFRLLGADLVGMSTVSEAIVARHMGQRVIAISIVTNQAAGNTPMKLSHEDVLKVGQNRADDMLRLLKAFIGKIDCISNTDV